jgi:hypothetical protein
MLHMDHFLSVDHWERLIGIELKISAGAKSLGRSLESHSEGLRASIWQCPEQRTWH